MVTHGCTHTHAHRVYIGVHMIGLNELRLFLLSLVTDQFQECLEGSI